METRIINPQPRPSHAMDTLSMHSLAWFARLEFYQYAIKAFHELFPGPRCWDPPTEQYIKHSVLDALARDIANSATPAADVAELVARVPDLAAWEYLESRGQELVDECARIHANSQQLWQEHVETTGC
jgi:hypothetical protein